jgi:hypothetical protein
MCICMYIVYDAAYTRQILSYVNINKLPWQPKIKTRFLVIIIFGIHWGEYFAINNCIMLHIQTTLSNYLKRRLSLLRGCVVLSTLIKNNGTCVTKIENIRFSVSAAKSLYLLASINGVGFPLEAMCVYSAASSPAQHPREVSGAFRR